MNKPMTVEEAATKYSEEIMFPYSSEISIFTAECKIAEAFEAGHAHAMEKVRWLVQALEDIADFQVNIEQECSPTDLYMAKARKALKDFKEE